MCSGMPAGLSGVCRTFCAYDRAGVGPAGLSGVGQEGYNTARRLRACRSQWGGREGGPTRIEGPRLHARQLHTELHPQPGSYGSRPHTHVSKLFVRGSWFRLLIACACETDMLWPARHMPPSRSGIGGEPRWPKGLRALRNRPQ